MKYFKNALAIFLLALATAATLSAQDPGWPRKIVKPAGTLIIYQPQVDDWKDFTSITWRQAFQLTPTGAKQVVGAASFQGTTSVDNATHMVLFYGMNVLNTYFPSLSPAATAQMDQLFRNFVPPYVNISLDRVVAYVKDRRTQQQPSHHFCQRCSGHSSQHRWRCLRTFRTRISSLSSTLSGRCSRTNPIRNTISSLAISG
jgi:hypothetical protein